MKPMADGGSSIGDGQPACKSLDLRVGDWVAVRSPQEILATLDENACLVELPFMPQMLQYCGRSFRVRKRAHKVCDTVTQPAAVRWPTPYFWTILCDGEAFGGCEMACSIIWKEAWLKRVDDKGHGAASACENGTEALLEPDGYILRCCEEGPGGCRPISQAESPFMSARRQRSRRRPNRWPCGISINMSSTINPATWPCRRFLAGC